MSGVCGSRRRAAGRTVGSGDVGVWEDGYVDYVWIAPNQRFDVSCLAAAWQLTETNLQPRARPDARSKPARMLWPIPRP